MPDSKNFKVKKLCRNKEKNEVNEYHNPICFFYD